MPAPHGRLDPAPPARAHVAASDCERCRDGRVAQPVNTASSLAYVAAGAVIAARAGGDRRRWWQAVAAAATATGLGSVAYHGPGGRWAKRAHDWSIVALAAALLAEAGTRGTPKAWGRHGAAVAAAAVALHTTSRTGGPLCRPDSLWQGHAGWHTLSAAALVLWARVGSGPDPTRFLDPSHRA